MIEFVSSVESSSLTEGGEVNVILSIVGDVVPRRDVTIFLVTEQSSGKYNYKYQYQIDLDIYSEYL